ncbi:MAG: anhydro-N-acetylmuramic acid kinase, partial [Saprospiraceae bacterium]|nr:anhydro-N-acetylmuramic acid kinase [Saprospiraceae bacterium]
EPAPQDLMATLSQLTAETIVESIRQTVKGTDRMPRKLYLSGGGAHNPFIVRYLKEALTDWEVLPMSALGIDGDAKEAVLFAALANETVAGENNPGARLGGIPFVGMGKISFPD